MIRATVILSVVLYGGCDIDPEDSAAESGAPVDTGGPGDSPGDSAVDSAPVVDTDSGTDTAPPPDTAPPVDTSAVDTGTADTGSGDSGTAVSDAETLDLACDGSKDDGRAMKLCGAAKYDWVGSYGIGGHCDLDGDGDPDIAIDDTQNYGLHVYADFSSSTTLSSTPTLTGKAKFATLDPTCDGDRDGDGYLDLLTASFNDGVWDGAAYVFDGPITAGMTTDDAIGRVDDVFNGAAVGSVAWVPDLGPSGDAIVAGSQGNGYEISYTYYEDDPVGVIAGEDTDAQFTYTYEWLGYREVGRRVESADMDGDGVAELIIGTTDEDEGDDTAVKTGGEVLIVSSSATGEWDLSDDYETGILSFGGTQAVYGSSYEVGDINDDGTMDIYAVVARGTSGERTEGAVFYGPIDGPYGYSYYGRADATIDITTGSTGDNRNAAILGDFDGDGRSGDLIVCINGLYIFTEAPSGALTEDDATIVSKDGSFSTEHPTSLGDINGDGLDDFGVADPYDDETARDAGAVYILFGCSW